MSSHLSSSSFKAALSRSSAFFVLAVMGGLSQPSFAADETDQSDEIVVTALRRTTSLQETPISIAAVGGELLQEKGAKDLIDIAASVPGFTMRDNGPGQMICPH